jgi:hypothetical protein
MMDESYLMSEIDFKDVKSAAHLPYDILVVGDKAFAQARDSASRRVFRTCR